MNWNKILIEDQKNPIERLVTVNEREICKKELVDTIISILFSFDMYMRNNLETTYNYYILDDNSIITILQKKYSEHELKKSLIVLDNCKVIYRFTVAKKFLISNSSVKQLRLNSWGKAYYDKYIDNEIKKNAEEIMGKIVKNDIKTYQLIVNEFVKKKMNMEVINKLNEKVKIKIVY